MTDDIVQERTDRFFGKKPTADQLEIIRLREALAEIATHYPPYELPHAVSYQMRSMAIKALEIK